MGQLGAVNRAQPSRTNSQHRGAYGPQSPRNQTRGALIRQQGQTRVAKTQPKITPAIQGRVLLNQSLVDYLCDLGADLTVINRDTFDRINKPENPILLKEYSGPRITSVGKNVKVLGAISIQRCVLDQKCVIKNAKMLVLEGNLPYGCIVGRDLIYRIPRMKATSQNLRTVVDTCSEELLEHLNERIEKPLAKIGDREPQIAKQEREIVTFPGFEDNSPTVIMNNPELAKTYTTITTKSEVEGVSERVQTGLNQLATDKELDKDLGRNRHMELKIKLLEPHIVPIRSKAKSIPHSIKKQVRIAIYEQFLFNLKTCRGLFSFSFSVCRCFCY